jgi:hypothetical protein
MISATGVHRTEGFKYALDNGAWTAFCQKQPFDEKAFLEVYSKLGARADFVVLPDIVAGGLGSLAFSMKWRAELVEKCPQLLAVQDGIDVNDIGPLVGPHLGIFVGGTDKWKEQTMNDWGHCARERGAYFHVGRVNTRRRIHLCEAAGTDSFDGSSASRYAATIELLDDARKQGDLWCLRSAVC